MEKENSELKKHLALYQTELEKKDKELSQLRLAGNPANVAYQYPPQPGISKTIFFSLLVLTIGLACYAGYTLFTKKSETQQARLSNITDSTSTDSSNLLPETRNDELLYTYRDTATNVNDQDDNNSPDTRQDQTIPADTTNDQQQNNPPKPNPPVKDDEPNTTTGSNGAGKKYKIDGIAYLYDKPEEAGRTGAFVASSSYKGTLTALDERDGYIYVEIPNQGEIRKAWFNKKDLRQLDE